jgi:hypothetical protein
MAKHINPPVVDGWPKFPDVLAPDFISLLRWIEKFLIRRPFIRNLLHKLCLGNQALLDQELRQCVNLREAGD